MNFGERFDTPKSIEALSEEERTKRLHHQLSVMYDRVFLSGDWKGERVSEEHPVRSNLFENKPYTDVKILVEDNYVCILAGGYRAFVARYAK